MIDHSSAFMETEHCFLVPFTMDDVGEAALFLKDPLVMYAWEHDFTDEDVRRYVEQSMEEHGKWGFSLMLARLRETGEAIGRFGLRRDKVNGSEVVELGYILARKYWGKGYAMELCRACIDYGFNTLGLDEIIAEIRPENTASVRVAERLGMVKTDFFVKIFNGRGMVHDVYRIRRG